MAQEQNVTDNPRIRELFRGKIKSLSLTTDPGYFPNVPFSGDDWEQKLTISSAGNVKLTREIVVGDWSSNAETQKITEKRKISAEDTAKIFNRIGKYFSTYHDPNIILDGGTWELKLTNTEGEVFYFMESTCYNHRSVLSRVSKFMRSVTGLESLLGFDEDTQYGFLLLNNIDKDPADVVKKVKKVARKEGFNVVKYEGEFDGARVYSPVFKEDLKIGMPQFILAKHGVAYLVIGEYGLRIIDALNNSKENGVR